MNGLKTKAIWTLSIDRCKFRVFNILSEHIYCISRVVNSQNDERSQRKSKLINRVGKRQNDQQSRKKSTDQQSQQKSKDQHSRKKLKLSTESEKDNLEGEGIENVGI